MKYLPSSSTFRSNTPTHSPSASSEFSFYIEVTDNGTSMENVGYVSMFYNKKDYLASFLLLTILTGQGHINKVVVVAH